jgi:hypothetical protein
MLGEGLKPVADECTNALCDLRNVELIVNAQGITSPADRVLKKSKTEVPISLFNKTQWQAEVCLCAFLVHCFQLAY